MTKIDFDASFTTVRGRPIPKEPLNFFQYKQGTRLFLNIASDPQTWIDDLAIAERMFCETVLSPMGVRADHEASLVQVQDILKQRMKYPGVKENPVWEQIAKTWVLPHKVAMGPDATQLLTLDTNAWSAALGPQFERLKMEPAVHMLKIEVADGLERQLVYKLSDSEFRPSLILVRWTHDLDEHIQTAYCAGHLMNCGYSLVALEGSYALYMFSEQVLYDTCSVKNVGIANPFILNVVQSMPSAPAPASAPATPEAVSETTTPAETVKTAE